MMKNFIKILLKYLNKALSIVRHEPKIEYSKIDKNDFTKLIAKDDPVILDIGSNDGGQTRLFLELFPQARIYSFEPDPRACQRYKNLVNDKRAKLFEVAISDSDGDTEFYVSSGVPSPHLAEKYPQGWDLSGSIKKPKNHKKFHSWCKFDKQIKVKTLKLDTWKRNNKIEIIDFIWADVQGAEVNLIKGAKEALKCTRYFYTEYNNWELYEGQGNLKQLMSLLPDFEVLHRYESDVLFRNKNISMATCCGEK